MKLEEQLLKEQQDPDQDPWQELQKHELKVTQRLELLETQVAGLEEKLEDLECWRRS